MKSKKCPSCGHPMKRNGKTKAGTRRWRCKSCGASAVHANDTAARELKAFLGWLLGKDSQLDMPGGGRSFRRLAAKFWAIWPMPEPGGEIHRVVYVDGIYVARNVVVLIACSDEHVLSWYLARSESVRAWRALLSRIAPPDAVVADGGTGFATAVAEEWPGTKVQCCLFHAFCQVNRQTTSRPRLQGFSGTGKAYMSCALAKESCRHRLRAYYVRVPDLEEARRAMVAKSGSDKKLINKLANFQMLVLDEWLLEKPDAEFRAFILEVMERRFEEGVTVFCTQFQQKDWHARLGGGIHADAIMDRVVHNATWIEMGNVNMRAKYSRAR